MSALDREDLPSGGIAIPAVNDSDDPEMSDEEASRAPFAPDEHGFRKG